MVLIAGVWFFVYHVFKVSDLWGLFSGIFDSKMRARSHSKGFPKLTFVSGVCFLGLHVYRVSDLWGVVSGISDSKIASQKPSQSLPETDF